MLLHKKRRYSNYVYQPDPINKDDDPMDVDEDVNEPNINMWEAARNTHETNRSMLNVAYRKKDDYITSIGDKAAVAGTDNFQDIWDDVTKIPNYNYNNMFSNAVSDAVAGQAGLVAGSVVTEFTDNPQLGLAVGGEIADKTRSYVFDKTQSVGNLKASQRYQSLDKYLEKNKNVNELVGHSLGGSVVLEKQKQDPSITTFTYGAPVISFGDEGNVNRYRTKYDYFSIFDRNAKRLDSDEPFNLPGNHSYEGLSGVTANTKLSDGQEILIE